MITISCILPMYNSGRTIFRALESIKEQTFKGSLQIIVVDDGSTDYSISIVKKFKKENFKLWIDIKSKVNGGVSTARNFGLSYAVGDYIAFLDSDDFWLREKLQVQFDTIMENPDIHLLGSTTDGIKLNRFLGKKVERLIKMDPYKYVIKSQLATSTVFFKKDIYDKIGGFDESMKYSEDMNYWMRIMEYYNCYLLNVPLVVMEQNNNMKHGGGLSNKLWKMEKGELKNINYIYSKDLISIPQYAFAIMFSLLKFFKRVII